MLYVIRVTNENSPKGYCYEVRFNDMCVDVFDTKEEAEAFMRITAEELQYDCLGGLDETA